MLTLDWAMTGFVLPWGRKYYGEGITYLVKTSLKKEDYDGKIFF
jgi:hypothetical protein